MLLLLLLLQNLECNGGVTLGERLYKCRPRSLSSESQGVRALFLQEQESGAARGEAPNRRNDFT